MDTPLFKGCAVIWAQGLPSSPDGLFEGKRRKTSITMQGRFKRELAFDDVVTGQEFARPAQNLPAKWLVETVLIRVSVSLQGNAGCRNSSLYGRIFAKLVSAWHLLQLTVMGSPGCLKCYLNKPNNSAS